MYIIAQTSLAQAADYGPLVAQFGFGGATLWILVKWMDSITTWMGRIDHALRSLSKAMWMDLASRESADKFVRDHARQMVSQLENDKDLQVK